MLKLSGIVLLLLGSIGMGACFYQDLKVRNESLGYLTETLMIIQQELSYSRMTLPMICHSLSKRLKSPFAEGFYAIYERTQIKGRENFLVVWREEMKILSKKTGLKREETQVLEELFAGSLNGNLTMQINAVDLALKQLESVKRKAREDKEQKGKAVLCLGAAFGLLLTIMLL